MRIRSSTLDIGERVPVLLLGALEDGNEFCHYHLDADAVEAALATLAQ